MEKKRIYPSTQLCIAFQDAKVLKVMMWILGWQSQGGVKYYSNQFCKALKMDEDDIERSIQTLVDVKLVDVSKVDGNFILSPNAEQFAKYYEVPIQKVIEGKGIPMADSVEWNCDKTKTNASSVEDMSDDEMQRMVLMLQARLKERREVKKLVKNYDGVVDDLPF